MIPLSCLLIGVVCLLPGAVANYYVDQVLEGCQDNHGIAFKDMGHRAFLYAAIVRTAGFKVGYSCQREKEAVHLFQGGSEIPRVNSTILEYDDSENWTKYRLLSAYDDYYLLLNAGIEMGKALKEHPTKTSIGCSYEKWKKAYCLAL